jgi:hypothetical protein
MKRLADERDGTTPETVKQGKVATKWADNLLAAIAASKQPPLERLLFALGIRHVGESTAKTLAEWLGSLALVRRSPAALLRVLPDIGGTVAEAIAEFFAEEKNQQALDALLAAGVAPQGEHAPKAQLRERSTRCKLLAALGIPKLTEPRARQLLDGRTLDDLAHLKVFSVFGLPDAWSRRWKQWMARRAIARAASLATLRSELLAQLPEAAAAPEGAAGRQDLRADRDAADHVARRGRRPDRGGRRQGVRLGLEEDVVRGGRRRGRQQAGKGRGARRDGARRSRPAGAAGKYKIINNGDGSRMNAIKKAVFPVAGSAAASCPPPRRSRRRCCRSSTSR